MKRVSNRIINNKEKIIVASIMAFMIIFALIMAPKAVALTSSRIPTDEDLDQSVYIAASKTPLSDGLKQSVAGILPAEHEDTLKIGDVEIDLSQKDLGYIYIRYLGTRHGFQIEINTDASEDSGTIYQLPATGIWAGLSLPLGPGEYHLVARPYDTDERLSIKSEQAVFDFTADFKDESTPFLYSNLYSYYDRNSSVVDVSSKLIEMREKELGRELTKTETINEIIGFVNRTIKGDARIPDLRRGEKQDYYFPDIALTLAEKRGCCADKCALAAAMLKIRGIPVQIIYGFVERKNDAGEIEQIYHAWLEVMNDGEWHKYDPTFCDSEITKDTVLGFSYLNDTAKVQ